MKQIPVAVQLYSVRDEAEKDFAGTVKKIAEMGYDGVELAGLYGLSTQEVLHSSILSGMRRRRILRAP